MLRTDFLRRTALFVLVTGVVALLVAGTLLWQFDRLLMDRARTELLERVGRRAKVLDVINGWRPQPHPADPAQNAYALVISGIEHGMDFAAFRETGRLGISWRTAGGTGFRELAANRTKFGPLRLVAGTQDSPLVLGIEGKSGISEWRNPEGVRVLAAYAPVAGEGLALIATISMTEMRRPLWRAAALTLSLAAILIVIVSGFYVWLTSGLERRLGSQRRLFESVLDAMPQRVFVKDRERRYVMVNAAFLKDQGARPEQVIGRRTVDTGLFDARDVDVIDRRDAEAFEKGEPIVSPQVRFAVRDGKERIFSVTRAPIRDQRGDVVQIVGVMEDVTAVLDARREAERTQHMLKALFDSIPHFVFVRDLEGRFLAVNRAMVEYYARLGLPDPMAEPRLSFGSIDPQIKEYSLRLHQQVLETRQPVVDPETLYQEPGGAKRTAHFVLAPVLDNDGNVVAVAGIMTDITDLKRTQAEMDRIFNLSPDIQLATGLDGYFKRLNPAIEKILGYSREELMAQPFRAFVHPDDLEISAKARADYLAGKYIVHENRYRRKDGQYRWIAWHGAYDPISGLVHGGGRDVTEEHDRKVALAESEQRFRSVISAMGEGLVLQHASDGIVEANAAAERILKLGRSELLGRNLDELMAEALLEDGRPLAVSGRPVADVIASAQPRSILLGLPAPDGKRVWVVLNVQPLFHPGSRDPYAAVCTLLDISERLWAERALAQSEHRYRALFAHVPVGIYEMDAAGKVLIVNERLTAITGLSSEQVLARGWEAAIHLDDLERVRRVSAEIMKSARPLTIEFRFVTPEGRTVWVEANAIVLRDEHGNIAGYLGALTDLTRRKRAEAAQVQSYNMMSAVSRAQSQYIATGRSDEIFSRALEDLAMITGSSHAMIGEERGLPDTGAGADPERAAAHPGETLIRQGQPPRDENRDVIEPLRGLIAQVRGTRRPAALSRADAPAPDAPRTFAALPVFHGKRMMATIGLAGRPEGYDESLLRSLEPILFTYGAIIQALRNDHRRQEAEAAIIQKNQQLESIFANMAEGIVILDRTGRVVQLNRLTRSMLDWNGIPPHEPEHLEALFGFRHPDGRPYPGDQLAMVRALKERQTIIGQQVSISRPWGDVALLVSASPLFDENRNVSGVVAILSDITELKKLDELKSEFIATVSHELRTPLAAILGYVHLILEGDSGAVTEDQRKYLEIVSRNTTRLTQLINDLLDVEKIESGKSKLNQAVLNLSALLLEAESTFRVLAKQKGLRLETRIDANLHVVGDGDRLTQVFTNLLSNAVKYSPAGQVRLEAERIGDEVRVTVADTGIGMTPESLSMLFTKFYRAEDDYTRQAGGTGLGLVISRAIVAQHAGRLEVSSVQGQGTEFRVFLPSTLVDHERDSRAPAGEADPDAAADDGAG